MQCKVCGHYDLVETEYRTGDRRAPALECARCHAINLDERTAKSERDLESVQRVVAARPAPGALDSSPISTAQVDFAVSEIDVCLAEARVALEFASRVARGEVGKAVADARRAILDAGIVVERLGTMCAQATTREEADAPKQGAA